MNTIKTRALVTYAVVAIITFGYAADWRWKSNDAAVCLAGENYEVKVGCDGRLPAPLAGLAGGALWPLYWSWVAWS